MANTIKANYRDKRFRLAWLQMSTRSGGHVDTFGHRELKLQKILRMQGIPKGPDITQFPFKMPTKSSLDKVEAENKGLPHMTLMANFIVSPAHEFQPSGMLFTPASAFQTAIDTFIHERCVSAKYPEQVCTSSF